MHWKLKSFAHNLIDLTGSPKLHLFLTKHVTKRSNLWRTKQISDEARNDWLFHLENLSELNFSGHLYEFGAGKNLGQNFVLTQIASHQTVIDLNPMLDMELINKAYFEQAKYQFDSFKKKRIKDLADLKKLGISYIAPLDAANTELDTNSFDGLVSTNTLEHIPQDELIEILKETQRILKNKAKVSIIIDYSDHYAHTDKNISLLNFLKYDNNQWRKYNHKSHYQNRLRHNDYKIIFEQLGFYIIKADVTKMACNLPSEIRIKYEKHDSSWSAISGYFLLENRK